MMTRGEMRVLSALHYRKSSLKANPSYHIPCSVDYADRGLNISRDHNP
jgi:hypothetical protein